MQAQVWSYSLSANLINLRVYSRVIALTPVNTDDSGQHGNWLKAWPSVGTLTRHPPCLQLIPVLCLHCLPYYSPCVNKQVPGCILLVLCLPAAANFYIVVSQDVVIIAQLLYLKCIHVLVETSIYAFIREISVHLATTYIYFLLVYFKCAWTVLLRSNF